MGIDTPSESPVTTALQQAIYDRANRQVAKVFKRVTESIIPKMQSSGDKVVIDMMKNDLYHLSLNPRNPIGSGKYNDWHPAEIRGLYFALYGEPLFL